MSSSLVLYRTTPVTASVLHLGRLGNCLPVCRSSVIVGRSVSGLSRPVCDLSECVSDKKRAESVCLSVQHFSSAVHNFSSACLLLSPFPLNWFRIGFSWKWFLGFFVGWLIRCIDFLLFEIVFGRFFQNAFFMSKTCLCHFLFYRVFKTSGRRCVTTLCISTHAL